MKWLIQFLNCIFNFRVKLKIFSEHPLAVGIILNISLMCINTKAGPPAPPLASHHRHILGADLQFLQFCLISMNDQLSDRHARRIFYLFWYFIMRFQVKLPWGISLPWILISKLLSQDWEESHKTARKFLISTSSFILLRVERLYISH